MAIVDINNLWADPAWRECFRLSMKATPRAVLGYGGPTDFDVWRCEYACCSTPGKSFGVTYVAVLKTPDGRFALLSGKCDSTIGSGSDEWMDDSSVDVQIAKSFSDIVKLAMSNEERERIGLDEGGWPT